jgi:ribosomal protein S18 acetylase RimI-like enzyme
MDIRTLHKDDLPGLLELYRHLHAVDDPLPAWNEIESVWAEIVAGERFIYLGGFMDGQLISSCTLAIIPNLTRACRSYGVIENVATHADHRRRGHGTALLHAALHRAWVQRCYKVMLLTGRKDEATLRFYRSAGFDSEGKQAFIAKPPA